MLVKIYTENPSEKEIDRVVNLLERDGVVIYPTDSVYAFGCSIRSAKAVERLRRIKGKDLTTFSVVFDSLGQIADYCRVDNAQFRLLKQNLPGPFTFLLDASSRMPHKALERRRTIGIRIPDNSIPRAIVERLGAPLLTSSVLDDRSGVDPRAVRPGRRTGDRRRCRRCGADDRRRSDGRRAGDFAGRQRRVAGINVC